MQRLLDAVGSKQQQQHKDPVGGDNNQEAAASSPQPAQDSAPETNKTSARTNETSQADPVATQHTSPPATDDPESPTFVVITDPADENDNAFTVYSAEQLGDTTMASSSSNPDGAPQMNWPPTDGEMRGQDPPRNPSNSTSLKASRAYSVASPAADKSRREPLRAENPHAIPVAGGQPLGTRAMEEREYRRKSRTPMDMGDDVRLALDREGSPDDTTAKNTQMNTIPARMNDNGEGSSKVEPEPELERRKSPSAPEVTPIPNTSAAKVNEVPAANGAANGTATESSNPTKAAAPKERRGSTLDNMLGKLGIGKKK